MSHSIQTTGSNAALIPVFNDTIGGEVIQLCCARALHSFMSVKRDFTTWIKGRIAKFGFVVNEDFITVENLSSPDLVSSKARAQKLTDYHLTLDMAKELSMVENNAKGREARRYFIACERQALKATATYQPHGDSINVAALLLSGQCDPKPLTAAQHTLIDQTAGRLVGEAYPLIRAHLERRVAWNTNAAHLNDPDNEVIKGVLGKAALGNCLAHHYHQELGAVRDMLRYIQTKAHQALGGIDQQLGLAH
ncbi:antA/AntB antirepressor family protein [Giesbergeria anulus]|uniref:Phage anti-repressor protein n=1 Tax=Giesbergeria anulus TaxID=180197 RepID=A0A1H9E139_9BURK|nr:antA/AntB antirepressor family protein [Giesbergeria anulus]SEQ19384.1 Phage anti-repressor protein [Giesbergeria anulus]